MLAVMEYRNKSPNPWVSCRSFGDFLQFLAFGKCLTSPKTIKKHQNEEAAEEFRKKWEQRIADAEEAAVKANEERLQALAEQEQLLAETEVQADISTQTDGGMSLDPLKPILYPIQQYLAWACKGVRFTRNVICWEESYYSFWLTAGSLLLGFFFFFIPWRFLFRWTSRIIVWALFGPHMKLVDLYWYSKEAEKLTEEELEAQKEAEEKAEDDAKEAAKAAAKAAARAQREELAKLKDMRQVLFGKYSVKVPILKTDRFPDSPLYASMATPVQNDSNDIRASVRVAGQKLVGHMIPKLIHEKLQPSSSKKDQ